MWDTEHRQERKSISGATSEKNGTQPVSGSSVPSPTANPRSLQFAPGPSRSKAAATVMSHWADGASAPGHGPMGANPGVSRALRDLGHSFGEDFSRVQVTRGLSGGDAEQGVRAVAENEHIAVGPSTYDHDGESSRQMLAHELAHIVQKRRGTIKADVVDRSSVSGGPLRDGQTSSGESSLYHHGAASVGTELSHSSEQLSSQSQASSQRDALEQEAEALAGDAASGKRVSIGSGAHAPIRQFGLWDSVKSAGNWVGSKASGAYQAVTGAADTAGKWIQSGEKALGRGVDWAEDKLGGFADAVAKKVEGIPVLEQLAKAGSWGIKQYSQFEGGVVKGAGGLLGGLLNMAVHPINTAKGLGALSLIHISAPTRPY